MPIKINRPKLPPVAKAPQTVAKAPAHASLVRLIHESTTKHRQPRPHVRVHASDLDPSRNWCPREPAVLTYFGEKRKPEFQGTAQQFTWSMGYATADAAMRVIPRERVWGNWRCRACKYEHLHQYTPAKCARCGGDARALKYEEVLLQDPESKLIGSCDVLVDLEGNHVKTKVELKSEGKGDFAKRDAASPDHIWRTRLYMYLAARTPWLQAHGINTKDARIMYVCKDGHEPTDKLKGIRDSHRTPFKEYVVERADEALTATLERHGLWVAWKAAFDAGAPLPWPEGLCSDPGEPRARRCAACAKCFSKFGTTEGAPAGVKA